MLRHENVAAMSQQVAADSPRSAVPGANRPEIPLVGCPKPSNISVRPVLLKNNAGSVINYLPLGFGLADA